MGKTVDFDECRLEMEKPFSAVNLSEDSEDDSDQRQLFELPKRKVVRPVTSTFKKKLSRRSCCAKTGFCCKVCFSTLVPIFTATFVAFTLIFLIVLMMGISGINKELEGLKVRVSYAEGAEKDFNTKRDKLRKNYEDKLKELTKEQEKVQTFQKQIQSLEVKIQSLNSSLHVLRKHPALDVAAVKSDLDKLKTGMADTGSAISKLENTHNSVEKRVSSVETVAKKLEEDLYNATVKISVLERKPIPPRVTTPKTLVVTLTPDENTPVKLTDFKKAIRELDVKWDDQSKDFMKEIVVLRNQTTNLNSTYFNKFTIFNEKLQLLINPKEQHTIPASLTTATTPPPKINTTAASNIPTTVVQTVTIVDRTTVATTKPTTHKIDTRKDISKFEDLDSLSKNFRSSDTADNLLDKRRDIQKVLNDMRRKKRWRQSRDIYNGDAYGDDIDAAFANLEDNYD